jgi:membrane protein YqaA with SNARE-associated domain
MFIAVLCICFGCLVVFFSSKHQQVLTNRLQKKLAWLFFVVSIIASIYLFAQQQIFVVACLLSLINIIVIWLILVFTQGHFRLSITKYLLAAVSFSAVTHWLGA